MKTSPRRRRTCDELRKVLLNFLPAEATRAPTPLPTPKPEKGPDL